MISPGLLFRAQCTIWLWHTNLLFHWWSFLRIPLFSYMFHSYILDLFSISFMTSRNWGEVLCFRLGPTPLLSFLHIKLSSLFTCLLSRVIRYNKVVYYQTQTRELHYPTIMQINLHFGLFWDIIESILRPVGGNKDLLLNSKIYIYLR